MTILEHAPDVQELNFISPEMVKCDMCSNKINMFQVMNQMKDLKDYLNSDFYIGYADFSNDEFGNFVIQLTRVRVPEHKEIYLRADGFTGSQIRDLRNYYFENKFIGEWIENETGWIFFPLMNSIIYYCKDHTFNCDYCSNYHPYIEHYSIDGDYLACESCFDEYGCTCDSCGDCFDKDNCTWIHCDEIYYCERCMNRQNIYIFCAYCNEWESDLCDSNYESDDVERWNTPNNMILDYSFKPRVEHFYLGSADSDEIKTLFGFELEIESEGNSFSEGIEIVNNSQGEFVYLKSDGSLNRGFEIVSHPFSFNYYLEALDFGYLKQLQELGYRSWTAGTCGFHIHISRAGFASAGHIWKFANLILGNSREWQKLAGRTNSRWASFELSDNNTMKVLKGEYSPNKYTAVNLSPRDTIEVRIFRGSLNERRLRSAIESVFLAMEYTRKLSVHEINQGGLSWSSFVNWMFTGLGDFRSQIHAQGLDSLALNFVNLASELGVINRESIASDSLSTKVGK